MIRIIYVAVMAGILSIIGIPLQWISVKLQLPSRRWIPLLFHKICAHLFGLRVTVRGAPARERPLLLVANHSSWLDITTLTSIVPVVFVAKSEIAGWPLFGLFAKLQRSVFVDRSRRQATGDVNRTIAGRLAEGDPVVLFGEGKASDGNRVLPFRTALLGALREALGDGGHGFVQPVSIAYTRLHGLPMGRQHRPQAAWYGGMSLLPHLLGVIREGALDVVVTFGVPIEVEPGVDRKALARATEDAVRRMTVAALSGRDFAVSAPVSTAVSLAGESR
ncbi:MAG: 1-acyl-sn-glycerol-3-phosphate acyltransferase [Bradyrhizobiaceae bacterium]|nr:1-acyl-sn-glycerol-3-phosphate acyltransferase [Bradyrhizobiaceae bacterium]